MINGAAYCPYIHFVIVWLLLYDLWRKIQRCSHPGVVLKSCTLNNLGYTCPGRYDSKEYHDFIGQYKFMICFENKSVHNYMTEKLINAYKAGTIPIYWGCPNAHEYINMESILFLKPDYTEEDITSLIKEIELLDNDSALYKKKFESIFFKDGVVPDLFTMDTLNMEMSKRIKLVERMNI
jgi:hypothetical protein